MMISGSDLGHQVRIRIYTGTSVGTYCAVRYWEPLRVWAFSGECFYGYDATGIVTAARTYRAGRAVVEFTVRMSSTTCNESKKKYIL
jgi:hypothetical protein